MDCVVFDWVAAKTISPSVLDCDNELVTSGVFRAENLNWVVNIMYLVLVLDKVCSFDRVLVYGHIHSRSLTLLPAA